MIKTTYIADNQYEVENELGIRERIDMRAKEEKENFSPVERMISAIAPCAMVDIAAIIRKRKKTLISLDATTEYERREQNPRSLTRAQIKFILQSPDATEEELGKAVALATTKYCSVHSSLDHEIDLQYSWEVVQ